MEHTAIEVDICVRRAEPCRHVTEDREASQPARNAEHPRWRQNENQTAVGDIIRTVTVRPWAVVTDCCEPTAGVVARIGAAAHGAMLSDTARTTVPNLR